MWHDSLLLRHFQRSGNTSDFIAGVNWGEVPLFSSSGETLSCWNQATWDAWYTQMLYVLVEPASHYRPQKQGDIGRQYFCGIRVQSGKQQEKASEVRDCFLRPNLPSSPSSSSFISSSMLPTMGMLDCLHSVKTQIIFVQWQPEKWKVLAIYLNPWHKEHSQTFFRQQSHCFSACLFSDFSSLIFSTLSQLNTNI